MIEITQEGEDEDDALVEVALLHTVSVTTTPSTAVQFAAFLHTAADVSVLTFLFD